MTTTVSRVGRVRKGPNTVYIGRPSKWGNPFVMGRDGDRIEVISKYRQWISSQPHLLSDLPELQDKILLCWCAPKACHGDVLAELVNTAVKDTK